jgi:hypothetical protein
MPLLNILDNNNFKLADVIALVLKRSKSDIRRLIEQGGVTVWYTNEDPDFTTNKYKLGPHSIPLDPNVSYECSAYDYWVIKVGKRKYLVASQVIDELLVTEM